MARKPIIMNKTTSHQTEFVTRVNPPVLARVNTWTILVVVFAIIFLMLIALFYAFHVSRVDKKQTLSTAEMNESQPFVSPQIQGLPSNYQETAKIASILRPLMPKQAAIPKEVQQELTLLRDQQTVLERQLEGRAQRPQDAMSSIQDRQAKESGLFFPGAAPQMSTDTLGKDITKPSAADTTQSSASSDSSYEQQNMQGQKIKFLEAADTPKDIYNLHSLVKPISPYEIQAGTIIPAVLLTGVNSSLPGTVVAQVSEDVYDTVAGNYLLVPKGSKVIGEYDSRISYGQERVLIAFTRVIRPDGSSILLSKTTGADLQGESGVSGNIDNHWMRILGAATLSTILSVGAGVAADDRSNDNGSYRSATQNAILGGAGSIAQTGASLTDRAMDIQPTLTIPPGFEFNIIVQKDMVLEPYGSN